MNYYNFKTKFLLLMSLFLLAACEGDIYVRFEWQGMTAYNASNASEFPEVSSNDSIPANTYCIQLDMHTNSQEDNGRYYDTELPPYNVNPLINLEITSDLDFDETHPAGTNLTSVFRILNGSYYHSLPADGSEGYDLSNTNSHYFREYPSVEVINLLLTELPVLGNIHNFSVTCTLNDGTIYNGVTNPIKLY